VCWKLAGTTDTAHPREENKRSGAHYWNYFIQRLFVFAYGYGSFSGTVLLYNGLETNVPSIWPYLWQVGSFNWNGHFNWMRIPDRENMRLEKECKDEDISICPTNSPTMAGGLLAINRKYFWDIGSYDEQMDGWGGENLEMSFRIWQCGWKIKVPKLEVDVIHTLSFCRWRLHRNDPLFSDRAYISRLSPLQVING
jgi:N-terminal domain of galactosyltransferase